MDSESDSDLDSKFSKHVCLFTVQVKINTSRLKEIKDKLQDEQEVDEDCEEEQNHRLNFHTWVEYKLGDQDKAKELNQQAVQSTDSKNITALMYKAFLHWKDDSGSVRNFYNAERCLDKVDCLKTGPDSEHKIAEANAELAYSFSRIGGADYISRAIDLYEAIVNTFTNEYTWKYRLGLAYRRSVHGNISTSMHNLRPVKERVEKAAKYLFDVASHCPEACLRGRALSQLAVMHSYSKQFLGHSDFERIFQEKNLQQLIDEALENAPNDARTLAECGRTLRIPDIDKAIDLLAKSLTLKKHAITYHHLGLCYESKAKAIAKKHKDIAEGRGKFHERNFSSYRSKSFENYDCANTIQDDQVRNRYCTPTNSYAQSQRGGYSNNTSNRYQENTREEYFNPTPQSQRGEYLGNNSNRFPQSRRGEYLGNNSNRFPHSQRGEYLGNNSNRFPHSQRGEYLGNNSNRFPHSQRGEYLGNNSNRFPHSQRGEYLGNNSNRFPQGQRREYSSSTSNGYPQNLRVDVSKTYNRETPSTPFSEYGNHNWFMPKNSRGHLNTCEELDLETQECGESLLAFGQGFLATNQTLEFSRGRRRYRSERPTRNAGQRRGYPHRLLRCPRKDLPLKRDDDYVTKAINCFKESIQISFDNNNPAIYNLGLILRACGLYEEAADQFIKIISFNKMSSDYLITVICAFEQCGLCLVELAGIEDVGRTESEKQQLFSRSEKYLLQAVSLAATLATKDPELKSHAQDIWNAFRTLEERYSKNTNSPKIIKKLIHLLQTVSQYEKIPAVIETLRLLSAENLQDPKVLKAALKGYLALQDYESGLTFVSVSMTTPEPILSDLELESLILKTQLSTAESRLRSNVASAKLILKPLFESFLSKKDGEKDGVIVNLLSPKPDSFDNDDLDSKSGDESIDVLILWDEKSPNKDTLESKASTLERCITEIFGIEVSHNLEKCGSPGLVHQLIVEEMLRPKLLFVLLEKHNPSTYFKWILDHIPVVQHEKEETDAPPPVVLLGHVGPEVKVQASLQTYKAISLEPHFENLNSIPYPDHVGGSVDPHWLEQGNAQQDMAWSSWCIGNNNTVSSVMTLYCSMIGCSWPLVVSPLTAGH